MKLWYDIMDLWDSFIHFWDTLVNYFVTVFTLSMIYSLRTKDVREAMLFEEKQECKEYLDLLERTELAVRGKSNVDAEKLLDLMLEDYKNLDNCKSIEEYTEKTMKRNEKALNALIDKYEDKKPRKKGGPKKP